MASAVAQKLPVPLFIIPTAWPHYIPGIATREWGDPQTTMFSRNTIRYAIVAAIFTMGTSLAYANGLLPDITVRKNLSVEVHQDGVGTTKISPNPLKPIPETHFEGNGELAKAGNAIDKIAREPQELPGQVLDAAKSEIMKQVDKFIEDLKAKAWAKFEELKAKYLPYVYLAAAAFVLILMLPGFIGALFAIWVVRSMDRRRARKQERQFNKALAVVKKHGDEIQSKLAA